MSVSRGGDQIIPRPPVIREGATPPWVATTELIGLAELRDRLVKRPLRNSPTQMPFIRADSAVLVALHESNDGPSVVLTKRSGNMRTHSGEIAFPGGRQDAGETLEMTALREAEEEVALRPNSVEIAGELDRLTTVTSQSSIYPFVGFIPTNFRLVPNPGEVESVFSVPLAELVAPGVFSEELWGSQGSFRPVRFFYLAGETVWGATATILYDLLSEMQLSRMGKI